MSQATPPPTAPRPPRTAPPILGQFEDSLEAAAAPSNGMAAMRMLARLLARQAAAEIARPADGVGKRSAPGRGP